MVTALRNVGKKICAAGVDGMGTTGARSRNRPGGADASLSVFSGLLNWQDAMLTSVRMSTLAEIEAAADALPSQQQEELFLYLAVRLRGGVGQALPTREFSREQIQGWIDDDVAGMRRFQEGR